MSSSPRTPITRRSTGRRESSPARTSTESTDHGVKLDEYQDIESVDTIVLIHASRDAFTTFERAGPTEWRLVVHLPGQPLVLRDPVVTITVDEIFAGTRCRYRRLETASPSSACGKSTADHGRLVWAEPHHFVRDRGLHQALVYLADEVGRRSFALRDKTGMGDHCGLARLVTDLIAMFFDARSGIHESSAHCEQRDDALI